MVNMPLPVAVVGATGYSGQELVRLLARHPSATVAAAFGSASTDTPRRLPALARLWDGEVQPFSIDAVTSVARAAFSRAARTGGSDGGPRAGRGRRPRVRPLGAFRLHDPALRKRWYPATPDPLPAGTVYGLPEFARGDLPGARLVSFPAASRPPHCWR